MTFMYHAVSNSNAFDEFNVLLSLIFNVQYAKKL